MAGDRLIENRSIDYIPLSERHGKAWHLWPIWFSGDAHLATLAVGVIGISLGGSLLWTAVAILLGCSFGTFFMAIHSAQGPALGLPQLIQSRPQFGYSGVLLVCGVALFAYVGYSAFNQVLAVQAIHQLFPSIGVTSRVAMTVFAALAAALAALGYDQIHRVQRLFAFFMIALLSIFSVLSLFAMSKQTFARTDFRLVPFAAQFFGATAYQISWSIYVSDYSRYLPRESKVSQTFWWTALGAFIGGAWMMLIGSVVASANPTLDLAAAVELNANAVFPGLGGILLVSAVFGLLTITTLNFYGASLTLLCALDSLKPMRPSKHKRLLCLLGASATANLIAWNSAASFNTRFADLLSVQLYLFTPWSAINLVDFYVVRRSHYSIREIFNPHGMYGRWSWRGLVAYLLGFLAMIPFFNTRMYVGPVSRILQGVDVSMLVGLAVSGGVYFLASRTLDIGQDRRRAEIADLGLS